MLNNSLERFLGPTRARDRDTGCGPVSWSGARTRTPDVVRCSGPGPGRFTGSFVVGWFSVSVRLPRARHWRPPRGSPRRSPQSLPQWLPPSPSGLSGSPQHPLSPTPIGIAPELLLLAFRRICSQGSSQQDFLRPSALLPSRPPWRTAGFSRIPSTACWTRLAILPLEAAPVCSSTSGRWCCRRMRLQCNA